MKDKIITARDAAQSLGYGNVTTSEWLRLHARRLFTSNIVNFDCNGEMARKYSVYARIDKGRWLADCPICSRSNYVDPDEAVFYCFGCGNQGTGSFAQVIFPEKRERIEALLLARPVASDHDTNPVSAAINSRPLRGLERNWNGESVEEIEAQNGVMEETNG